MKPLPSRYRTSLRFTRWSGVIAAAKLRATAARRHSALEAGLEGCAHPLFVFDVGDGGQLLVALANGAAIKSGRVKTRAWRGRPAPAVLVEESLDALQAGYTECMRLGEPYVYEEFVTVDGHETWWMTTLTPIFDRDHLPSRLVATHLPVDFLRPTEEALRRSEANIKAVIDSCSEAVFVLRQDRRVVYANPAATEMLGANGLSDLVGRSFGEFLPSRARPAFARHLSEVSHGDGARPRTFEQRLLPITAKDPIVVEIGFVRIQFDREPCTLVVADDVTESRALRALLASNGQLDAKRPRRT